MFLKTLSLSSIWLCQLALAVPTDDCPILGPTYSSAFDLSATDEFRNATEQVPTLIQKLFELGTLNETHTSFAIDVFSTVTNSSIWSYFHEAPGLNGSLTANVLNDETIFRVGSVSKLFTAYAILISSGLDVYEKPVTEYLPELAGNGQNASSDLMIWEDVTVGALMSHQAGTGGIPLESFLAITPELPRGLPYNDYLALVKATKRPLFAVGQTTAYSDLGYSILGRVLERITNSTYEQSLQNLISRPLNLNGTYVYLPPSEGLNALALPGDPSVSSWTLNVDAILSSGGVYASNADLRALGLSILHSELLSPADTRYWMKPRAHSASLAASIGAPWEIYRLALPVSPESKRTRLSDMYTKAGGQAGYGTVVALSPDHGIGFTINTAGESTGTSRFVLHDLIGESFMPAAELAAASNAAKNFAGTYADQTVTNTNITLTVDADKPGLGLESWYVGGVDWKSNVTAIAGQTPSANLSVRLYPNGVVDHEGGIGYYAVPGPNPVVTPRSAIEGGSGLFDRSCETWLSLGFFSLNGTHPEEFVFTVEDGKLQSVYSVLSQVKMDRI